MPASGNLVSGSWHPEKANASAAALTWTFKVNGDELTMTSLTGQSYTAKLDGTEAPFKGDPGVTSVSVKMHGKDTLEETRKRDGKVIAIFARYGFAMGKTLKIVAEDKLQGMIRQGRSAETVGRQDVGIPQNAACRPMPGRLFFSASLLTMVPRDCC